MAGKMYPDPTPVRPRTFAIAGNAISTIVYDRARSDLHKLFLLSCTAGISYNVSVIPAEVQSPLASTDFDPQEMSRLFQTGAQWALSGLKWRVTPPGTDPGEGAKYRAGTALTDTGRGDPGQTLGPPFGPIPCMMPQK